MAKISLKQSEVELTPRCICCEELLNAQTGFLDIIKDEDSYAPAAAIVILPGTEDTEIYEGGTYICDDSSCLEYVCEVLRR